MSSFPYPRKLRPGYVTTFFAFQCAYTILVEYVCPDGHRIRVRQEDFDWQDNRMVWQ